MFTVPSPVVRKNKSFELFHDISFTYTRVLMVLCCFSRIKLQHTSTLNCSCALAFQVLVSKNVTRSSLFPTAMVRPLGLQHIFIFSPEMSEKVAVFQLAKSNDRIDRNLISYVLKGGIKGILYFLTTDKIYSSDLFTGPLVLKYFLAQLNINKGSCAKSVYYWGIIMSSCVSSRRNHSQGMIRVCQPDVNTSQT